MKIGQLILATLSICFCVHTSFAQEESGSFADKITSFPTKFLNKVNKKADNLEEDVIKQSTKYLQRLAKQERKLQRKLSKVDSAAAKNLFAGSQAQYQAMIQQLKSKEPPVLQKGKQYLPRMDSLTTSLKFLDQYSDKLKSLGQTPAQIKEALAKINGAEGKLQQAEDIRKFIRERKQLLREQFQRSGLNKAFRQYNKEAYYYAAQLEEYKKMFSDPDKLLDKSMGLLRKLPLFQDFFKKHSELASLFNLPGSDNGAVNNMTGNVIPGLQTRSQVQSMIQQQLGITGPNVNGIQGGGGGLDALQQNMQSAQTQLNQLKDKVSNLGGTSSDMEMPEGFKPNSQRTKTFLQRLEYGTTIQTIRSNNFFPATSDLGLTLGFKLSEKNIIGVGASYKLGWGRDIKHISFSSQGIGFRSFLDMKLKGSFYASGGFEYNYQKPFASVQQIKYLDDWSKSGLIGISKVVSMKTKLFKKTKVQLLWDFLSYQQKPVTQPIKFRIGYSF